MERSHPLYAQDRAIVDRLLAASTPSDPDIVDCARLLMRYLGYPGARDIQEDLARAVQSWHMDTDTLYARSRQIWAEGYRPSIDEAAEVGSGADVNAA